MEPDPRRRLRPDTAPRVPAPGADAEVRAFLTATRELSPSDRRTLARVIHRISEIEERRGAAAADRAIGLVRKILLG